MKILPIPNYNNYKSVQKSSSNPAFTHHPDFVRIGKHSPICASSYFRRGFVSLEPAKDFADILNVFKRVFSTGGVKKFLIVGIGNSQEPFSYLSAIKPLKPEKPPESFLDLHIMDLQSKPDEEKLFEDSYTEDYGFPDYCEESFIYDPKHSKWSFHKYRVTDEIFNYLNKTYNDGSKSKWETRVQEGIKTYPSESFDIISINNVLYYLEAYEIAPTVENIYKALKPNGYLITEHDRFVKSSKVADNFERVSEGIFRKIK